MFKVALVCSILFSGTVFAQNMAESENYQDSYVDMPDGSSRYVGKCSTHEDYEKFYFKTKKTLQKYVEPRDLELSEIDSLLSKFDPAIIKQVLTALHMYDIADEGVTEAVILKEYIDDLTVETISHVVNPELELIRFNVGVGGGNGGYLIFNKVTTGSIVSYEMMSYTFDSDINYCDKKVWL